MIKKTFFIFLLAITIISFGCNVAEELIDAAIVDTVSQGSDSTTVTTSSDATALIMAPQTTSAFSAIIPSESQ
jgi:hypothetical protein